MTPCPSCASCWRAAARGGSPPAPATSSPRGRSRWSPGAASPPPTPPSSRSLQDMSRTGQPSAPQRNGRQPSTVGRKADHILINLHADVEGKGVSTGFDQYHFLHQA